MVYDFPGFSMPHVGGLLPPGNQLWNSRRRFVADYGDCFVSQYDFDTMSGLWSHKKASPINMHLSLDAALGPRKVDTPFSLKERENLYNSYFEQALSAGKKAAAVETPLDVKLEGALGELQFFAIARETNIS